MGSFARTCGCIGTAGVALLAVAPAKATSTSTAGRVVGVPCSAPALVAAVTAANAAPTTTRTTLRLAPSCSYDLIAELAISGNVSLVGGPATVIRRAPATPGNFRIFEIAAVGTLRVRGLLIANGNPNAAGGGILNLGTLVLTFVTVSGNRAIGIDGGGVVNAVGARAWITDSVISANIADGVGGGIDNFGRLTLAGSRVSGNGAGSFGGGVTTEVGATTRIMRSTIDHNVAVTNGGGVFNFGTTSLDRTVVVRNRAASGGGVFNTAPGTVGLRRSLIRVNTPDNCAPANAVPGCAG
jgi:hypothetical protein